MKNFELLSFASPDELASAAAEAWLDEIESVNRSDKAYCVALSGGRITGKFFAATVEQAKKWKLSFARVHFFWADERCVPPTDPDSNFKLASDLLFAPLNISEGQIHRIRGEESAEIGVKTAGIELSQVAPHDKNGQPVLDLVFLGMGEDGHVASLFPNASPEILNCTDSFLSVVDSPKPPPKRISMSYGTLANARHAWALVSGGGKSLALQESLSPSGQTPFARVIQARPWTKIFADFKLLT